MDLRQATDQAASVADDVHTLRRKFGDVATFVTELDAILASNESGSATLAVTKINDSIKILQYNIDHLTVIMGGMRKRG
jgi:hypothetical protein